jgi:endonuclease/exonuclease/phosphatase family metal-dependent hydrolase
MNLLRTTFSLLFVVTLAACSGRLKTGTSASNSPVLIRVMAYNIHHANPPSKPGLIDIDAIAKAIKDQNPDLVALQEVDANTIRSGKFNQAEEIAKRLGMSFFFAKAIDHEGGDYGVAILSKYPMSETKISRLPTEASTKGEPRVLATAKISLPGRKVIRFGSTHLDAQKAAINRELQIKEINRITAGEKLPFIIAGDFNAAPGSTVIQLLDQSFTRTCQQCEFTIPVIKPNKTIDFIAFTPKSKFSVQSTTVIPERYASDHLPVLGVLQLH